jgi:hypothetical protein
VKTSLTAFIHGESKVGKSWLGDTVPAPRLIIDAEGRAKWTPSSPKVWWDPMREAPPVYDGTWQTCVVNVHDFDTMQYIYNWLQSGQHPFVSATLDSVMEIQKRCIDKIAGIAQVKQDQWGELLRRLEALLRSYRDLTLIESNPLKCVVFISGTQNIEGQMVPLLQGAIRKTAPYYMDVCGYYFKVPTADGTQYVRRLWLDSIPQFVAGDGTNCFPQYLDNPNIGTMFTELENRQGGT